MSIVSRRIGLAAALLLAACNRTPVSNRAPVSNHAPVSQTIAECGATIDASAAFRAESTTQPLEQLRLSGPDGVTVSVSCLPKINSGPTGLAGHADWVVGELVKDTPPENVHLEKTSTIGQIDGHAALALELVVDGNLRSTLVFTERAQNFYWIRYSAPSASFEKHAKERGELLRSFHVTDSTANRGPTRWWHPEVSEDPRSLSAARAGFHTKVRKGRPAHGFDGKPAPTPPRGIFEKVAVPGPVGRLGAYITPDFKDGKKHPAVIWAHGGFGDIGREFWEASPRSNDQSAGAFREAGIVLAIGSWRAENDNPGDYELFYGEVGDFLALKDHVAKLSYVDPSRIYLAGHSSGGTLVLLAAELSGDFRAAFSIGGSPLFRDPATYAGYGGVPFDFSDGQETLLRSAAPFVRSIRRPTFYFEGSGSSSVGLAQWMADQAAPVGVPFQAFVAMQADHFSILAPLTELISRKILADSGPVANIGFTQEEIDALPILTL